ncbi:MAG: hypothetical protein A2499_16105 [Stygiobacter sp. RIFOXYC12_FULL_38_8]|nr:MAG: hypothetical protein A2X62_08115 [Stygiobacter sp. GWC2_38_9]OGU79786.1 MAG: hypothetical protein A2279_14160 [Stygiobacter sp. RIFOXYA12_FULL_38_9]OGV07063.1 MAG: hypothetical protein A2299_03775 [Stygiobacter sp. RIFOXYB2_FULL_37_11]OGV10428.1 MAG: hypothetical protein A2237_03850 [Stygiobacter sp. RIFOXYA2_FULL_38_8]OGV12420.1 MAG: hypothetical protein A2440_14280 [Stygiobacter sp. RIFOXYC2_FULL_38_25]OGV24050.1 MAG: hypothetical protein A2499_16105 [Stygiobacter sp. RIFOXYC12_FULL_
MVTFKKHIVCVINTPAKFSYRLLFILFLFLTSFSAAQNLVAVNYNESNQPIQKVVAVEEQIEFNSLSGDGGDCAQIFIKVVMSLTSQ